MLGRSTRSAVGPTDATSMVNSVDSRNPLVRAANFVPGTLRLEMPDARTTSGDGLA
jgi:hypothetical protein